MMDVRQRPGPAAGHRPEGRAAADHLIQVLFIQAKRRRRRIRLTAAAIIAAAAAAIALAVSLAWPHRAPTVSSQGGPLPGAAGRAPRPTRLIWVDTSGEVVTANLATLTQRVLAQADADPATPLVPFGGRIYWVKFSGGYIDGALWPRTVEELNPATGTSTTIAPGEFAFTAPGGQRLYIARTDTSLTTRPAGHGQPAQLTLPAHWYLPGGSATAVANGLTVWSQDALNPADPAELAVWNPTTGQVRVLGRAHDVISAYTPPGASYSLLAWMPARCRFPACPITITNTATLASRTLTSPLGQGFITGGEFSPNGQQFATFAATGPQAGGQTAELAIASTATGQVRLMPRVRMTAGEDTSWIRWLPSGTQLATLAGPSDSTVYLVTPATFTARPYTLTGTGQSINYSAELIPPQP